MSDSTIQYKKLGSIATDVFSNDTKLLGYNNVFTTNTFTAKSIIDYVKQQLDTENITSDIDDLKIQLNSLTTDVEQHSTGISNNKTNISTLSSGISSISSDLSGEIVKLIDSDKNLSDTIATYNGILSNYTDEQINIVLTTMATNTQLGMVKLGYSTDEYNKKYAVSATSEGDLFVEVPWSSGQDYSGKIGDISVTIQRQSASIQSLYTRVGTFNSGISANTSAINKIAEFEDDTVYGGFLNDTNISVHNLCLELEKAVKSLDAFVLTSNIVHEIGKAKDKVASQKLIYDLSVTVSNDFVRKSELSDYIRAEVNRLLAEKTT